MLVVGAIVQRFAGLRMEFLAGPFADRAIEFDVRRVQLGLAGLSEALKRSISPAHFIAIEIAVVVVQIVEIRAFSFFGSS